MSASKRTMWKNRSRMWWIAYAAVAVFAIEFVWLAGHRGFYMLDQSIMFEGAWRVFQGQTPYRDFVTAFPPVAFFIQSLFFHLAGVDFSAMVLAAAVLNGLATICVISIVRRLLPDLPILALAAGLLTAAWFQAPFGTLWFEQTAFFFNLLSLTLLVEAAFSQNRLTPLFRFAAGTLLSVAMLSKQNAGVEFVPVALGIAATPYLWNVRKSAAAVLQTCAGVLAGWTVFAVWLWTYSSPATFWYCYVLLTRQIGVDRVEWGKTLLGMATLGATWPYSIVVLLALFTGLVWARRTSITVQNGALITWIVVGCTIFQNLFKLHTFNEVQNALPYMGLIYGLSLGLLLSVLWTWGSAQDGAPGNWTRIVLYVGASAIILGRPLYDGLQSSWDRRVQEFKVETSFNETVQAPGMSRVKWGEPTFINDHAIFRKKDFEELNAWLSAANSNFFAFPDSIILYGLQRRISPQPWLYFSPGHSFLLQELPRVDAVVTESLERNNVRVLVLETESWLGNEAMIDHMPKLHAWIADNFKRSRQFGIFEVWTHKDLLYSDGRPADGNYSTASRR